MEVYILIDLCSAEARIIIFTGSNNFHKVAIFLSAYFPDGRQSINSNLKMAHDHGVDFHQTKSHKLKYISDIL